MVAGAARWVLCAATVLGLQLGSATRAHGSIFVLQDERELAGRSIAVVTGRVDRVESRTAGPNGGIHTYVSIAVEEVLAGALGPGTIVLREPGGQVADRIERVFGSAQYRAGEHVLVFLDRHADGALRTTSLAMGKYTLRSGAAGRRMAARSLGDGVALWNPRLRRLSRSGAPDATALHRLLESVRSTAIGAGAVDEPALRVPPELMHLSARERELGSGGFTFVSFPPVRWFDPDDGLAVGFRLDRAGAAGIGADASIGAANAALAVWSGAPGSTLALVDAGNSARNCFTGCPPYNQIVFDDPCGEAADPIDCTGVLALGGYCATTEPRSVNGTIFHRITRGKVTINDGWSGCAEWDICNLAEVLTHELGHTVGFGHSSDPAATMWGAAHFDGRCATLEQDDLDGLAFIYPDAQASPTGTSSPSPTASPDSTGASTKTATRAATGTRSHTPTRTFSASRTPTLSATPTATPTAMTPATLTATGTPLPADLAGRIRYDRSERSVPQVLVALSGSVEEEASTDAAGSYDWSGLPWGVWLVEPRKSGDLGRAVSALDAAHVLQAASGLRSLDRAQRLACDVTGDGSISSLDAATILQLVTGERLRLPIGESCQSDWVFHPEPPAAPNLITIEPVTTGVCRKGAIQFVPLTQAVRAADFRATVFGDCTGNWQPPGSAPLEWGAEQVSVRLGRPRRRPGAVLAIPVYVRSTVPFHAVEIELAHDISRFSGMRVRAGAAAGGAEARFKTDVSGRAVAALASAEPLPQRGRFLVIELTEVDGDGLPDSAAAASGQSSARSAQSVGEGIELERITVDERIVKAVHIMRRRR